MILVIAIWATFEHNALSIILFVLAFPVVLFWLATTLFFLFVLKPLAEALLEYLIESVRCNIWEAFGCVRSTEKLDECERVVVARASCFMFFAEPLLGRTLRDQ